ncbi:MAG: uracil-DNA glycosylase [Thermodesulfobacteriota bacterium]
MPSHDLQDDASPIASRLSGPALATLLRAAERLIRFQHAIGVESYPRTEALTRFLRAERPLALPPQPEPATRPTATPARQPAPRPTPPPSAIATPSSLDDLAEQMRGCQRCHLHQGRSQVVVGQGQAGAPLFIVADGPSGEDNQSGLPMSGEPGQLLDRMLGAIGLSRQEVYLTTLTKCHGPTTPSAEAVDACLPFLLDQIASVGPRVICAMGPLTAQKLLHSNQPLSRLRGKFREFKGMPVMATFHPEFLLANPELKKASWVDLQLIQKRLQEG